MVDLREIREENRNLPPFQVRAAWPEDASAIVEYLDQILADRMASIADRDEMMLDVRSERDHLRRICSNPLSIAVLAEHNREIIGFLTCEGGRRRKIAHIGDIGMSVRADWRRNGIGTALLDYAESWARSTGKILKLTLNVFETNEGAIALYRKSGFEVEGRLAGQIQMDGLYQDLILMAKHME